MRDIPRLILEMGLKLQGLVSCKKLSGVDRNAQGYPRYNFTSSDRGKVAFFGSYYLEHLLYDLYKIVIIVFFFVFSDPSIQV